MSSEFVKKANKIQSELYKRVFRDLGYVQKGRVFNKITDDDLVHVVVFKIGRKFEHENNQFSINFSIIVPEWQFLTFNKTLEKGKIYDEGTGKLHSSIGLLKGIELPYKEGYGYFFYELDQDSEEYIINDAEKLIREKLLPMFENLKTRDDILQNASKYAEAKKLGIAMPDGIINKFHLAMIMGAKGNISEASKLANEYYKDKKGSGSSKGHLEYVFSVAKRLGIAIDQ